MHMLGDLICLPITFYLFHRKGSEVKKKDDKEHRKSTSSKKIRYQYCNFISLHSTCSCFSSFFLSLSFSFFLPFFCFPINVTTFVSQLLIGTIEWHKLVDLTILRHHFILFLAFDSVLIVAA